jgi:hypothetical protein
LSRCLADSRRLPSLAELLGARARAEIALSVGGEWALDAWTDNVNSGSPQTYAYTVEEAGFGFTLATVSVPYRCVAAPTE